MTPVGRRTPPRADQWIIVSAPSTESTTGALTAYERAGDSWRAVFGPVHADLGEGGVGAAVDDSFRTPVGT